MLCVWSPATINSLLTFLLVLHMAHYQHNISYTRLHYTSAHASKINHCQQWNSCCLCDPTQLGWYLMEMYSLQPCDKFHVRNSWCRHLCWWHPHECLQPADLENKSKVAKMFHPISFPFKSQTDWVRLDGEARANWQVIHALGTYGVVVATPMPAKQRYLSKWLTHWYLNMLHPWSS